MSNKEIVKVLLEMAGIDDCKDAVDYADSDVLLGFIVDIILSDEYSQLLEYLRR